ncbi:MAG: patatin-like phospholipase family protein [Pyramidobacter sp.]|jgi:NTE family protein
MCRKIALLIAFVLLSCAVPLRAAERPYVVLALSGGGIKGYAHIGVLEELEKAGIGVAGIVATSMGAIVGSLYASGQSPEEMERIVSNVNLAQLITASPGRYFNLSEKSSRDISVIRPEIQMDENHRPVGPLGLVSGTSVLEYFAQLLSNVTVTDFNKLPIPFAAVATDLVTGEKVVLRHGSLASAVRASMSLPGIFDPWELDGRLLVDGGMVSNMPVETARELFPGYPVVAVNLTSELSPRRDLTGVASVVSQSITILTMQNVRREAALADFVINPGVKEYPVLGTNSAQEIVQQGRDAATKAMPKLLKILKSAPRHPIKPKEMERYAVPRVMGVRVTGVPDEMAHKLEREFLKKWLGRPVSMPDVVEYCAELTRREDVRNVDYDLQETDRGVVVHYKVQRMPPYVYRMGSYASTLSSRGWLKLESLSYDILTPGDTLRARLYLSQYWGADLNYYWGMDISRSNFWEADLSASHYRIDLYENPLKWQKYSFNVQRHFTIHDRLRLSAGVESAYLRHVEGADSANWFAPFLALRLNLMDDPDDPVNGFLLGVRASWPDDTDSMMLRVNLQGRRKINDSLRVDLSGGFVEGEMGESPIYAAYLGAEEELLSLSQHPLMAERFAWWRLKFSSPLTETMFGPIIGEVFGGQGYAWDHNSVSNGKPWEVGIALRTPPKLIDGRIYALYSDRDEWRFGVRIGVPDWDVFRPF